MIFAMAECRAIKGKVANLESTLVEVCNLLNVKGVRCGDSLKNLCWYFVAGWLVVSTRDGSRVCLWEAFLAPWGAHSFPCPNLHYSLCEELGFRYAFDLEILRGYTIGHPNTPSVIILCWTPFCHHVFKALNSCQLWMLLMVSIVSAFLPFFFMPAWRWHVPLFLVTKLMNIWCL